MTDEPTAWQRVQLAREPTRPHTRDYLREMCDDFVELAGDRFFGDDRALVAGLARFAGRTVVIAGHQKGRDTAENIATNFGMAHPEGYQKARRLMEMAARFGFPVITLVDTPGAHPGVEAEERNQAAAIARNLQVMALLETPIVTVVIGEGGSGGALGIAVADRVLMLENSVYSVISPEGCAAILWKKQDARREAAAALRLTAADLRRFGIIDEIVPEPAGGAHRDPKTAIGRVREALTGQLASLEALDTDSLLAARRAKYRRMGVIEELPPAPGPGQDSEKEQA